MSISNLVQGTVHKELAILDTAGVSVLGAHCEFLSMFFTPIKDYRGVLMSQC